MLRPLLPLLLFLLGILLVHMGAVTLRRNRRQEAPGAFPFGLLMLSAAVVAVGTGGELLQRDLASVRPWLHVKYLGLPWIPTLWLWAVAEWAGRPLRPWLRNLLLGLSAGILLAQQSGGWHDLFLRDPLLQEVGPFRVHTAQSGPLHLLHLLYGQVAAATGAVLLGQQVLDLKGAFRRQALLLLLAALVPWAAHMSRLLGLVVLDPTPFALALSALCIGGSLYLQRLFDLTPVAWPRVVEALQEAVLVLDPQDRLVDANPAAWALFPQMGVGQPLGRALEDHPALVRALEAGPGTREVALESPWGPTVQEVRVVDVPGRRQRAGRAAILSDVTDRVRLLEEVRKLADTDGLTGVANRRRFQEALRGELDRSARKGQVFSLLLLDVDHFKRVNDVFGHGVGDAVLVALARLLQGCLRRLDQVARVGGEEFAILLPQTDAAGARLLADRIRARVEAMPEPFPGLGRVTVSVGMAVHQTGEEAEALLARVDAALYRAKFLGRNRVCAAEEAMPPRSPQ